MRLGPERRSNTVLARKGYKNAAGTAIICAALSACGAGAQIPDALLEPAPCPDVPAAFASDRALATFVLKLDACAQTRGRQLTAIRDIVKN